MKRKIITIILISLFALTSSVYAFSDVDEHWAKDTIEKFNNYNLIEGYEDNTFKPDKYMTRAEIVTIINRMTGVQKESSKYIPDIMRSEWYYSEIRKAVESGIIVGDLNGNVNPDLFVTREEAIVMISRAFCIESRSIFDFDFFDASDASDWSRGQLATFINFKYINGYDDNTIRPNGNITRAEFVTIVSRIFNTIVTKGTLCTGQTYGNMLVIGKNVILKELTVNGNLIIAEGTKQTIAIKNVGVKGNLILWEDINEKEIYANGKKVNLYNRIESNLNKYVNMEYGITFSLTERVTVTEFWLEKKIKYKENQVILNIEQSEENYLKSIETIGKEKTRMYDNIYKVAESNTIGNAFYILYDDITKGEGCKYLIIKRDNTVYTILFNDIKDENLIDNVLATMELHDGEKISDRKRTVYKNNALGVKFAYREGYIGVDDSYNTKNIYSGDVPFKLFIQVTTITDMQDYSMNEAVYLLKSLAIKEGTLVNTETLKIAGKDAVKFKIVSDDKIIYSLYVVVGNTLYDFIFTADATNINELGETFFSEIERSLEF